MRLRTEVFLCSLFLCATAGCENRTPADPAPAPAHSTTASSPATASVAAIPSVPDAGTAADAGASTCTAKLGKDIIHVTSPVGQGDAADVRIETGGKVRHFAAKGALHAATVTYVFDHYEADDPKPAGEKLVKGKSTLVWLAADGSKDMLYTNDEYPGTKQPLGAPGVVCAK